MQQCTEHEAIFPPLGKIMGALLVGAFMSSVIYGVTILQAYRYFRVYPRDKRILKALVVTVVALSIHSCYVHLINGFAQPADLLRTIWSISLFPAFSAVVMLPCQRIIVFIAGSLCIGELGFFIASTCQIFMVELLTDTFKATRMLAAGALCGTMADISLTVALIFALRRSRTGFKGTDSKIDIMILYSVNTGLLTGIVNLVFLVFAFCQPNTLLDVAAGFVAVKMYATTLLAALNSRQFITSRKGDGTDTELHLGIASTTIPSLYSEERSADQ
ncbi:hypothetical protein GY45DRAFT_115253 [Cubamyces sp. BRFM 1775]|nr:hypothetical protein GY45DRAFT_115253 [Cubamyces sp. BRFM 1775]